MKYIRVLAGLMFLTLPTIAAATAPNTIPFGGGESVVVPADSPVHFAGFENDKGAVFQGRFLLTGTYYYGDNEFNDSGYDHPSEYHFVPEATIIPDEDVVTHLPRFAIRNERYNIHLENADAFANATVSKAELTHVRRMGGGYASGHIAIWVDQFSAKIACDGPSYSVRFLSVSKPAQLRIASNEPHIGC